jgi:hypothetical protein
MKAVFKHAEGTVDRLNMVMPVSSWRALIAAVRVQIANNDDQDRLVELSVDGVFDAVELSLADLKPITTALRAANLGEGE